MKASFNEHFAKFTLSSVIASFKITKMKVFFLAMTAAMAGMVLFASLSRETEYSTRYQLLHDAVVYVPGRVTEIVSESTSVGAHGIRTGSQYLRVEILRGELKGEVYEILNHLHIENSIWARQGQILNIYMSYSLEDPSIFYAYVATPERSHINYIVIFAFFVMLSIIGGRTGIRSVFALVFTFVSIIFLLIPLIVREWPPILTTMSVAVIIVAVSLVAILGFTKKAYISMISVGSGIVFCCMLYFILSAALSISGYHAVNLDYMLVVMGNSKIGVGDLLFCAILISALGGLMDIAVSVTSSVNEISESNLNIGYTDLWRSSLIVARDNAASMANTMILAFTGSFFISLVTFRIKTDEPSESVTAGDIMSYLAQSTDSSRPLDDANNANEKVTRAMFVEELYKLDGSSAVSDTETFNDVTANAWYHNAVQWAVNNGIIGGVGDGRFIPTRPITRQEMAAMLYKYAALKNYDIPELRPAIVFADINQINEWAAIPAQVMYQAGLFSADNNEFRPYATSTRAEVTLLFENIRRLLAG